ncbi:MAG: DUF262 domain-containing HNH endonuclease family protein [Candidatus Gracilibacteria bacterium]|jgi:uncharacterized protein with ParB-like and HNH nuclease domain
MKRFHETKDYRFNKLVDVYRKFGIPNFQRAYKWKSKQITDFFYSATSNEEAYFIGNIVCVAPNTSSQNKLLIIDGQQRLTTISLALIALRDHAANTEILNNNANTIKWINKFLKDTDVQTGKDYYILIPRKNTFAEVFEDLVESKFSGKKYDKGQTAYIKGYNILRELIEQYIGNDTEKLNDTITKILNLEFVAIVLESDKDVFDTFEGLNSKGIGLSVSDLVKNHLFCHAENLNCLEQTEQIWLEIESDFEKINPEWFPKFLRHLWISKEGYITGKDLYNAIKTEITRQKTEKNLITYCKNLRENSKFYLGVRSETFHHYLSNIEKTTKEVLIDFCVLENQQVFEILLALNRKMASDKRFKPKYFRDIAKIFWNFCLRTQYLVVSPSLYEKIFADYCEFIGKTNPAELLNKSKVAIEKLRNLTRNRDEFIETIASEISYLGNSILIDCLLEKLIASGEKNRITLKGSTIEHILPQEPKEWGLTKKDIKDYVHNLGNLTLLNEDDNNKAENKKMAAKCKEIYQKSHFSFNRDLESKYKDLFEEDWKLAIEQRGKDIAAELYKMSKI